MSSSRSKNFRRRSDGADHAADDKPAPKPAAPKPANPKPVARPSRLSFADDDDEDESPAPIRPRAPSSAPPRPASFHKHTASKDRSATAAAAPPMPSNMQPQAGEYTVERLRELQKNARPLGAAKPPPPPPSSSSSFPDALLKTHKPEPPAEPVIVLKGLLKPTPPTEKDTDVEDEEDDAEPEETKSSIEKLRFGKLGIDRKPKDSSGIPDRATINAIREKRERLRHSRGAAPDYISLDSGGALSSRASAGGSSDEEDGDFRGRIALFGDKKDDGMTKGVFESIDERLLATETRVAEDQYGAVDEDGDDEDEEDRKWEEEQVRKGLGKRIDEAPTHLAVSSMPAAPPVYPQPSNSLAGVHQSLSTNMPVGPNIGVSRSANVLSIAQQAEVATRALHENIAKLKETHNRTMSSMRKTDENLVDSLSDITALEESLETAGKKFVFMQQLRDFISIMCDFLQDKAPFIEELEEQMQKLHEERASAVLERRAADSADESGKVEAAVNAALAVLSKGSTPALLSAAATAAQAVLTAAGESSDLPIQLDEFGRDINLQKCLDLARRVEARKRRKARSESKRMSQIGHNQSFQRIEGESSTDESDSESSAYKSSRDELLHTAAQIFSDAADEFSKLSIVKERFEKWKRMYASSYRDAYMSLSAPAVFSPYVRLELLKWDPLYYKTDFNDMEWHDLLFDYGLPAKDGDFDPNDADANLIPELVEKVALPILHHEIAHCWDMLSTEKTENAVFATSLVITYVPASSVALQELLAVVRNRLDEAITSINVPLWSTVVMNAVTGAAQLAAYRFGMSVRLLRNICLWKDILALPVLENLALEELLGKKLLPHIRSIMPNIYDAITRTERIVASISGVWSGSNVRADYSQKLQPVVECVEKLGRKLEERRGRASEEETVGLARRLKKMLVELNEYDKAREILRRFQLKEAL